MKVKIPGYEMLRPVAEGGMASVYLAIQESLGRYVAIKLLKSFDNPGQASRFRNEGRIIASLNHRNIITIHDIGVHEDRHYISMEYLEGGDLEARIQAGMGVEEALDLLEVMASCLEFLHGKAIIHRDIKPANILFHKDGTPVLTDFGVARQLETDMRLTMEGSAVGSPHYLSPEQAECKPLDGRTDIYSLGIIFHEMLTGMKPFQGKSHIETILAHITEPVPSLPPALRRFQKLLDRMIAKDPHDRFATAAEMLGHLRGLRQSGGRGDAASGRIPGTRAALPFGKMTRVLQSLHALEKFSRITSRGITAPVTGGNRHRRLAAGAVVALLAIPGVLAYHFSMQAGRGASETDSPALSAVNDTALAEASAGAVSDTTRVTASPGYQATIAAAGESAVEDLPGHGSMETGAMESTSSTFVAPAGDVPALPYRELLRLAQQALEEYRLTTPGGDNAYDYYRSVLEADPGNAEALAGVGKVADRYASLAEREIDQFHYGKARTYIDRGLAIAPDNARLRELDSRNSFSGMSQRAFSKVRSLLK